MMQTDKTPRRYIAGYSDIQDWDVMMRSSSPCAGYRVTKPARVTGVTVYKCRSHSWNGPLSF